MYVRRECGRTSALVWVRTLRHILNHATQTNKQPFPPPHLALQSVLPRVGAAENCLARQERDQSRSVLDLTSFRRVALEKCDLCADVCVWVCGCVCECV